MKYFGLLLVLLLTSVFSAAAQADACGCESQPLPAVWASVNGVNISELDAQTAARVKTLYAEVADARSQELDLQINSRLLELEATKKKTTVSELIDAEVLSKAKAPTPADIEAFFNANRTRIEGQTGRSITLAEVSDQIRDHLKNENQQIAANAYAENLRTLYGVKKLADKAAVPTAATDRQKVLATIGTFEIRSSDIEDGLRPVIYSVQRELYRARKNSVDLTINDKLLSAEATKRGVTSAALLDAEVNSKIAPVTEAEAQAFFNENKARLTGDFAKLKPQIIQYMNEERREKASIAYAEKLRAGGQVKYFFTPPQAPKYDISVEGHGSKGAAAAKVTLTVFTDYQCPTCALAHPDLDRLVNEYAGKVRLVVYNFPLNMHADARKAAEAAEAARAQGKFWEYAALLYKNQSRLAVVNLKEFATAVGLDRKKFDADLDSGTYKPLVEADLKKGESIGVNATPTIFLNGRPLEGFTYQDIKAAVDEALKLP